MASTKTTGDSSLQHDLHPKNMDDKPNKRFAEWLREKRLAVGLIQQEAADKAKFGLNTWSRLEQGYSTKRSTVIKVAEVVGGDPAEALHLAGFASDNGTTEEAKAFRPHVPLADVSKVVKQAQEAQVRREYEEAEGLWRQAIAAEPENQEYSRELMSVLYRQWDPDTGEPQKIADSIIQIYKNLQMAVGGTVMDSDIRMMFRSVYHMPDDASGLFVGRHADVEKIVNEFKWPIVTLCGPEGIGKTELARAVMEVIGQERQDGACFVPLGTFVKSWQGSGGLTEQERVAQALLFTLKAARMGEQTWTDAVVAALTASDRLIVLDGCTSLRKGCAALVETLQRSCPNVRILATCRGSEGLELGRDIERVFKVPTLDVNFDTEVLPTAGLLFKKRAEWIGRAEEIKGKKEQVASICRRVNGLTTYVAWAASLLKSKSLENLEKEVPLPDKDKWWKWLNKSLNPSEQKLLRSLRVFPNGWTREAAQHVCAAEDLSDWQIASNLEKLDAGGLIRREGGNDADRGWMWEPLYEVLSGSVEKNVVSSLKSRLLDWCMTVAERDGDIYHKIEGLAQRYDQIEREIDNIRAALAWSFAEPSEEAIRGLRLASLIGGFWNVRGYWTEGRFWLNKALMATELGPPSKERLGALNWAGILAIRQQDFKDAERCLKKALQCDYPGRTADQEAAVLNSLGYLYMSWGETDRDKLEQARDCYENACKCYGDESLKNNKVARRELKWPLSGLGDVELALYRQDHSEGRLDTAAEYFQKSLTISEEFDDKDGVAQAERHFATISEKRGEFDKAERCLRRSLIALNGLGNRAETISVLEQLADLVRLKGTKEVGQKAARLYKKAVRLHAGAQSLRQTYGASNESEEKNRKTLAESREEFGRLLSDVMYNEQWQEGLRKSSEEIIIDALSDPVC